MVCTRVSLVAFWLGDEVAPEVSFGKFYTRETQIQR